MTDLTKCDYLNALALHCHQIAKSKGFWDEDRNEGELLALMHSELSEALEALRKDDRANLAEELADTLVRILDFCGAKNINISQAVRIKMEVNRVREYRHGKKF